MEVRPRSPDLEKQYSRANVKKIYREIRSAPQYVPLRDPATDATGGATSTWSSWTSRAVQETGSASSDLLPDIYVTEHYDALCLNSGVFFVRSNAKTLEFFLEFLRWQYEHVFADNQNGFDAFLRHSCADSYVPAKLPAITYLQ